MDWKKAIQSGPFSTEQSAVFISWLEKLDTGQLHWLKGYFVGLSVGQESPALQLGSPDQVGDRTTLTILYGTQTGNSHKLAQVLDRKCKATGIDSGVQNMALFKGEREEHEYFGDFVIRKNIVGATNERPIWINT